MLMNSLEKVIPPSPVLRSRLAAFLLSLLWNRFILIHSKGLILWNPGLFWSLVLESASARGPSTGSSGALCSVAVKSETSGPQIG